MHVLLWTAAGQLYAVPTAPIQEVTPVVRVRAIPQAAHWVSGMMNYRGAFLPVIDFSRFLDQATWTPRMASRILIVQADEQRSRDLVGLLVESVLGSEQIEYPAANTSTPKPPSLLGPLVTTPYGTVQHIELDLLPRVEMQLRVGDAEHAP